MVEQAHPTAAPRRRRTPLESERRRHIMSAAAGLLGSTGPVVTSTPAPGVHRGH
jgi:hypothetical protein